MKLSRIGGSCLTRSSELINNSMKYCVNTTARSSIRLEVGETYCRAEVFYVFKYSMIHNTDSFFSFLPTESLVHEK